MLEDRSRTPTPHLSTGAARGGGQLDKLPAWARATRSPPAGHHPGQLGGALLVGHQPRPRWWSPGRRRPSPRRSAGRQTRPPAPGASPRPPGYAGRAGPAAGRSRSPPGPLRRRHLVEHQSPARPAGRQHHLEGQPDPGQLAAGGHLGQAAWLAARLALNSNSTWSAPDGPSSVGLTRKTSRACGMASGTSSVTTAPAKSAAAARRASVNVTASLASSPSSSATRAASASTRSSPASSSASRTAASRAPGQHLVRRGAVLAGQSARAPAGGDLLQPTRFGLQVAEVAGQVGGDVGQPVAQLRQPAGEGGQRVVTDRTPTPWAVVTSLSAPPASSSPPATRASAVAAVCRRSSAD